jgi:HlyD family secretion protein
LTEEQRSKLEMVLISSRQEIQEIRGKAKPEEARIRIQNLLKEKVWGFLTEEQRKKFAAMAQSSPTEETKPGRAWMLSKEGKPVSIPIVLGITDGTFSEVVSGNLREGTEIIVDETSNKKGSSSKDSPPRFMRGMGR